MKPEWIVIVLLAILFVAVTVQACTPVPSMEATATGVVTDGSTGSLHPASRVTCTREAMDACEYGCMMPGGILDLHCYEDCIYSIC